MPEHDFLYSLREDVPDDFKAQLKQQLDLQEPIETSLKSRHQTWWTVAVASVVTLILSVGIVMSRVDSLPFMKPLLPEPDLTNHGVISSNNLQQLQVIDSISRYAYDFVTYQESVIIGTSQGMYEHSVYDLNAEPIQLTDDTAFDVAVDAQGNVFYQRSSTDYQHVLVSRWDRQTNETRQILTLDPSIMAPDSLYVSEDGESVYINTCVLDEPKDTAYVDCNWKLYGYDVRSGEQFTTHELNSNISKVSQSRDGKWLVYFTYDIPQTHLYLKRVNLNTDETVVLLQAPYNPDYQTWITASTRLTLNDDGTKLLTGSHNISSVKIWDVEDLLQEDTPPHVFEGKAQTSFSIAESSETVFDPTSNYLIQSGDWNWRVYDIHDDPLMAAHPTALNGFSDFGFSTDGKIAIGMASGLFYTYDAATWEEREVLSDYTSGGTAISFTADGKTLITNRISVIWDISSAKLTADVLTSNIPHNHIHTMRHAVISPDGQYVAYQSYDAREWANYGHVFVKNLETEQIYEVGKLVTPMAYMRFLEDNTLVIVSSRGVIYHVPPEKLDVEEDEPYTITQIEEVQLTTDHQINTSNMTLSSDGGLAALWDCENYNVRQLQCEKASLHLWDITNQQAIIELDDPTFTQPGYIDFSADGQQLAFSVCVDVEQINDYQSRCLKSEVRIYHVAQLQTGENDQPFAVFQTDSETFLAYHPLQQEDGSFILAITIHTEDGQLQFWRVASDGDYELLSTLPDIHTPIVFSPTGDMFLTVGMDVWSVPSGR